MSRALASSIQDAFVGFLQPLAEGARDLDAFIAWLGTLGQTAAVAGDPALAGIVGQAADLIDQIAALDDDQLESWSGLATLLKTGRRTADIVQALRTFASAPARAQVASALAEEVVSQLLASYLRRRHPTAFRVASLLTLVAPRETASIDAPIVDGLTTLRYSRVIDRFDLPALSRLLSRPGERLQQMYFPNGMSAGADAWLAAARLFPHLSYLAEELGLAWRTEHRSLLPPASPAPGPGADTETPQLGHVRVVDDEPVAAPLPPIPDSFYAAHHPTLRLVLGRRQSTGSNGEVALEIASSSRSHPGGVAGLIVTPVGDLNLVETRGQWKLTSSASGRVPAFTIEPDGFSLSPAEHPLASGSATLALERIPPEGTSEPAFVVGAADGTRLEIGAAKIGANVRVAPDASTVELAADARSGALVLAPRDGDGFLSAVLPAEGMRADFDLGLTWSSERGVTLRGSAGLETTIPIGMSVAGVASLSAVHLSVQARDARLVAEVSASAGVSLGPFQAAIERVGVTGTLTFPEGGGNLGLADLDVQFKPPTGVGLAIDAQAVVGGGFLLFDPQKGEYSGTLQLEIADTIAVKATGLLATRMPDGSKGYSLLAVISAENFPPVQLGYGFVLRGIGGLLALNRTFDEEALRAGLKNRTLDTILFPKDPIRNAAQILSNLNRVFPPASGHHLFGPAVRITWGTPTLITADLAVVLEFGARLRLLVLGQVKAILPRQDNDLVRLQMGVVGVIDVDQGTVALDASLYDSRLLRKFVLTGDMAMRLNWGPSPNFALAVGGLHPAFNPPPKFPALERVAINLAAGDNPRFRCEAYFALTSNTVQFGARAELYAAGAGFSIQGETGFDVLIQVDPFHFLADFYAQVQLKRGRTNLFKVRVEGALAGPRPLHIKGKATFEVLWMDVSIRFDKTLVEGERPPRAQPVNVLAQLKDALANPANWTGRLPERQRPMVTLRARLATATDLLVHPLGTLTVKQGVVPLDLEISRFGQAPPAGPRRFAISRVSLGGRPQTTQPVKDAFAPAQFLDLSDSEKLSWPSFQSMVAGVSIGSDEMVFSADADDLFEADGIEFETIVVGAESTRDQALYRLSPDLLEKQARFGAAGSSDLRRTGAARYRTTGVKHKVVKEGWSIVNTADPSARPAVGGLDPETPATYSEAAQALRKAKLENPSGAAALHILRRSELHR